MVIEIAVLAAAGYGFVKFRERRSKANDESMILRRLEGLGVPDGAKGLLHDGGLPELPQGPVVAWQGSDRIYFTGLTGGVVVPIMFADVVSIDIHRRKHRERRGSRYAGQRFGSLYFGKRIDNTVTVDESTTEMVIRYGKIKTKVIFEGGEKTYAAVASLLAGANRLPSGR